MWWGSTGSCGAGCMGSLKQSSDSASDWTGVNRMASTVNNQPGSSAEVILRAENIAKTFAVPDGELTVLEDVSLEIPAGQVVALLGRSGSGKSTLLRIMAGLIPASKGKVLMH